MHPRFHFPDFSDLAFPDLFGSLNERIRQEGDALLLSLDVPGYSDQDLKVQAEPGYLVISGDLDGRQFRRAYTMPSKIDLEGISASAKHGVLSVKLPFLKAALPRQIQVN